MNKLVFGSLLVAASSLNAANVAYVDANSASPESPYETWDKASTLLTNAVDAVDSFGTVTIAEGTYIEPRAINSKSVTLKVEKSKTDSTPGKVTLDNTFFRDTVANSDPDKYHLTLAKGHFVFDDAQQNVFIDADPKYAHGAMNYLFTVTGKDTFLDTRKPSNPDTAAGRLLYHFFTATQSTAHYTDHCVVNCGTFYFGTTGRSTGKVIIDDHAIVTNGAFRVGVHANDRNFECVISNATMFTYNEISVGVGVVSKSATGNKLVIAGEAPDVYCSKVFTVVSNCELVVNMSEMPTTGFAKTPITFKNGLDIRENSIFTLEGLAQLDDRLNKAGVLRGEYPIMACTEEGQSIAIPDSIMASLQEQAAVAGFKVKQNPDNNAGKLVLFYENPAMPTTIYVTPEGTEGNTPTVPYSTIETAANSVKTGSVQVATGGTVIIASGTYDQANDTASNEARTVFKDHRMKMRAVKSLDELTSTGRVVLANRGFASGYVNTDPDKFNVTFEYGTFAFAPNSSSQVFSEYTVTTWGQDNHCTLTVTGPETFWDNNGYTLYHGFTSKNALIRFTDHAKGAFATINLGRISYGTGATIQVDGDAKLELSSSIAMGIESTGNTVVVSNGYFKTYTFEVGNKSGDTYVGSGAKILLAGDHPRIYTMGSSGRSQFYGNSEMVFDVSEAPLTGYKNAPYIGCKFLFDPAFTFKIQGAETLLERMRAAGKRKVVLNLIQTANSDGEASLPFDDDRIAAMQTTLPDGLTLGKSANKGIIQLTAEVNIGFLIMAQ